VAGQPASALLHLARSGLSLSDKLERFFGASWLKSMPGSDLGAGVWGLGLGVLGSGAQTPLHTCGTTKFGAWPQQAALKWILKRSARGETKKRFAL